MSFTYMNRAEYVKWREDKPPVTEIDTNKWITELVDAVRKGMVDEYLEGFVQPETLVFSKAEYLWGKEASQHFFNRLHDAREKQELQTVLVTDLNEKQAAIFHYHMNISCALYKLSDYHFQTPECPAVFEGDGYAFVRQLFEWQSNYGVDMNTEVDRILSEIHPKDLPDHCIYPYQRAIGDYYLSIGAVRWH